MLIRDIVNTLTIFQLITTAIILFLIPKGRKSSNRLLALFFLVQSMCVLNTIIWRYFSWSVENIAHFIFIPVILLKLWGPALYLYVRSMTLPSMPLRKKDLLHTLPMFIYAAFMTIRFNYLPLSVKKELLIQGPILTNIESNIVFVLTQIVNFSYVTASLICLFRYQKIIMDLYSNNDKINLKWLRFIVVGFSSLWLLEIGDYIVFNLTGSQLFIIRFAYPIVFMLSVYTAAHGWLHPEIFVNTVEKPKYEKYPMSDAQKQDYLNRLHIVMNEKKPYLNPELELGQLAQEVSVTPRALSQILNDSIGQNFYDYINTYRIKAAQASLTNPSENRKTILEILFEVGFNSKSTFNVAFKKYTGMTPSDFKNRHLSV